ncbi:carbamoyltransferase HypF [Tabrizicola sp. J26]|uniref:carbamoyltransferase HypF n=1 Tax=Alitabrizicola rongguiensis TaxID=2909234 RepID=UPI001F2E5BE3|nr:carbamoyltransferase HypF [Tabrizicola rongguiensis]MCF1709320.1 carbamoyltransferase HypF [Tabrizicola rongguiensis]
MHDLRIRVRGQVQGVGFRPFVWQIAREAGAAGEVLNDPEGVLIHIRLAVPDTFLAALRDRAPPLARIDAIEISEHQFDFPPQDFLISASRGRGSETRVTPDAATCPSCAAEIRDPLERRFGYAFTNCTHCGPRFTILTGLPYDRGQTTMARFPLCSDCRAEYDDPADRRFHAQPVACPACGPRLWLEEAGAEIPGNPIDLAVSRLEAGQILAVKGLGGFHLACDARSGDAISELRRRKRRPAKPLAVMATLEMIARHSRLSPAEVSLLSDPAAPIVLLTKAGEPLPDRLAPGLGVIGWMLPYTPLHHLLIDAFGGPLVMTSGNLSGEPQVIGNEEARQKLSGFADAFLMHDRDIARRLDDSVERVCPSGPMVLRRGRGRVPGTLPLPAGFESTQQILAFGGQMKSAICLVKNGQAMLSHHLGDLDDALTQEEYGKALADCAALFDHDPTIGACDLHPDYVSTREAERSGMPLVRVQHHHAHLASCLGDALWPMNGGPVAGIILDGTGYGSDGTVWGGEVLLGDYRGFERIAHLRPAPLPGGDAANVEPWRNAVMRLDQAGLADWGGEIFPSRSLETIRAAAAAGFNAPLSSSAGRLFDAVAALLGLYPDRQSYEGEAAMRLEAMADEAAPPLPFGAELGVIEPAPMIAAVFHGLRDGVPPERLAGGFQSGLACAFAGVAREAVVSGRARAVALSGGCFQNPVLLGAVLAELKGISVLVHARVPANDGGLAFGQALIAAAESN